MLAILAFYFDLKYTLEDITFIPCVAMWTLDKIYYFRPSFFLRLGSLGQMTMEFVSKANTTCQP